MSKGRPKHDRPGRQKHGAGVVAEGYSSSLGRQRVAELDGLLVQLKGGISHVALACLRQRTDAADLVRALLADVDGVRQRLVETEAEAP